MTDDAFLARLSPFDRQSRARSMAPISCEAFVAFLGEQAREYSEGERARLSSMATRVTAVVAGFPSLRGAALRLAKTSGKEEGNFNYTRGDVVYLPGATLGKSDERLLHILAHEMFHVASRKAIGLRKRAETLLECQEVETPSPAAPFDDIRITNPDKPVPTCALRLTNPDGVPFTALPVLVSASLYTGGVFTEYIRFRLAEVEIDAGRPRWVLDAKGAPRLHDPEATNLAARYGKNTNYLIDAEEILAENFALLVRWRASGTRPGSVGDDGALLALEKLLKETEID